MKSMHRAINYDGLLPAVIKKTGKVSLDPIRSSALAEINDFINANRAPGSPFDIIVEGRTPANDPVKAAGMVASYQDAGTTWWIEALWDEPDLEKVFSRIKQDPPFGK